MLEKVMDLIKFRGIARAKSDYAKETYFDKFAKPAYNRHQ